MKAQLQQIKLAIFDVDGVFTDGSLHVTQDGQEFKTFNVLDGLGIVMLLRSGVQVAIISGRHSSGAQHRFQQLGIQHIHLGISDKHPVYEQLSNELRLKDHEILVVGDDIPDLALMQRAGISIAVANATKHVKPHADYITVQSGGKGAVREVCELILEGQDQLQEQVDHYALPTCHNL